MPTQESCFANAANVTVGIIKLQCTGGALHRPISPLARSNADDPRFPYDVAQLMAKQGLMGIALRSVTAGRAARCGDRHRAGRGGVPRAVSPLAKFWVGNSRCPI